MLLLCCAIFHLAELPHRALIKSTVLHGKFTGRIAELKLQRFKFVTNTTTISIFVLFCFLVLLTATGGARMSDKVKEAPKHGHDAAEDA